MCDWCKVQAPCRHYPHLKRHGRRRRRCDVRVLYVSWSQWPAVDRLICTFCLALLFLRVSFDMIFMAASRCESIPSTSKHLAKPPLPRKRRFWYWRTTGEPPLKVRYSIISGVVGELPHYFAYMNLDYYFYFYCLRLEKVRHIHRQICFKRKNDLI